jgi:hypothetical protein
MQSIRSEEKILISLTFIISRFAACIFFNKRLLTIRTYFCSTVAHFADAGDGIMTDVSLKATCFETFNRYLQIFERFRFQYSRLETPCCLVGFATPSKHITASSSFSEERGIRFTGQRFSPPNTRNGVPNLG